MTHKSKPKEATKASGERVSQSATTARAANAILDAINGELKEFVAGQRKRLRDMLLRIYTVARDLRGDPEAWHVFCEDGFWQQASKRSRPDSDDPDCALRYALMRAIGLSRGSQRTISKYYCLLNPCLVKGVSPKKLKKKIEKRGGIFNLKSSRTVKTDTNASPLSIDKQTLEDTLSAPGKLENLIDAVESRRRKTIKQLHKRLRQEIDAVHRDALELATFMLVHEDAHNEFCRLHAKGTRKPHVKRAEEVYPFVVKRMFGDESTLLKKKIANIGADCKKKWKKRVKERHKG